MRRQSKEEDRRIVEDSFHSGITAARMEQAHGFRPGQNFQWRHAYKEGGKTLFTLAWRGGRLRGHVTRILLLMT